MGNHFHLLVQTPKANLSEFMRHFNIAYTGAYNRRHKRVGHLYQGRYKAILVEGDIYLLELSRYLHLNPIRIKPHKGKGYLEQWRVLEKYRWSSLRGYLKASERESWVNYDEVLGQVGGIPKLLPPVYRRRDRERVRHPVEEVKGTGDLRSRGICPKD